MRLREANYTLEEALEIIGAEELLDVPGKLNEPDERRLGLGSWLFHHGYDDFAAYIPPSWGPDEIGEVCGDEQPIRADSTWTGATDEDIGREEQEAARSQRRPW